MNILWLKTELLHPLDKGGRIRTYHMLRELKREHRVTYLTLDEGDDASDAVERAAEYCSNLVRIRFRTASKGSPGFYWELAQNLVSSLPYAIWKYRSSAMTREIERRLQQDSIDLVVCDFLFPAVNLPHDLAVPAVLFQHNVEAMIWQRHAEVASNTLRRRYLNEQWRRMWRFERAQCLRFDHVVAVSPDDVALFAKEYGVRSASYVPTGVDTEYFRPTGEHASDPHGVLFTGSMDWMPNEDAVTYFVESMLPRVRRTAPEAELVIAGRNPSPAVIGLGERHPRVTVTGTVADMRPYLERARVVVVPLRIGGGTRLKIFEAMAMARPIVTTSIGAEGLPVHDGEHVLIRDTPEAFADAVACLLADPAFAADLGRRAADLVRARFGWRSAAEQFANACLQTIERATPPTLELVQSP